MMNSGGGAQQQTSIEQRSSAPLQTEYLRQEARRPKRPENLPYMDQEAQAAHWWTQMQMSWDGQISEEYPYK